MPKAMAEEAPQDQPTPWWVWALCIVTSLVGLKYGFDFGMKLGGVPMGLLTAVNTAVFGWIMVGGLLDKLRFGWHR